MTKPGKAEKWAARSTRLKAALRENLKKRKRQAKGRELSREDAAAADAAAAEQAGPQPQSPDFRRNQGGN